MTFRRNAIFPTLIPALCLLAFSASAQADCGDPTEDGSISASDALFTLRASVGQISCKPSRCDVDSSGSVSATDALKVLKVATGQDLPLACTVGQALPGDPRYVQQWGLEQIRAPEVWAERTDCSDVTVAVIDTGVDFYHPDLVGNLWRNPGEIPYNDKDDDDNGFKDDVWGWDFWEGDEVPWDWDGHGTHVSGIIGAQANSTGVVGVCWEAEIMAVRFLGELGFGFSSDGRQAMHYARKMGARVINNSWGGGAYDEGLRASFQAASDADISIVGAAGNDTADSDASENWPVNFRMLTQINVAAIGEEEEIASFSNFGATTVDLAAPGVGILSTVHRNDYDFFDGTSMASPFVAGAAAMLRSEFPNLSGLSVRKILTLSARPNPELTGAVVSGGHLDLAAAFEMAEDPPFDQALEAAAVQASAPAPKLRGRSAVQRFTDARMKYPKLQKAVEHWSNGKSATATMVADHVIATLRDGAALENLRKAGFKIRKQLKTDGVEVLVEAPESLEATEAALAAFDGVTSTSPDYLLRKN